MQSLKSIARLILAVAVFLPAFAAAQPEESSEPNAASEYLAIVDSLAGQDDVYIEINDTWRRQRAQERWTVLLPESLDLLERHQQLLDRLLAATDMADCRWGHDISEGMNISLGHAGLGRIGLRLILLDALRHLEANPELATARFWTAIRFSEHYGADELHLIDLVAAAMLSTVYNILETDDVRPLIPVADREALVAHLDHIESSDFPDFERSAAVDVMIYTEEIHYFIETGQTRIPEDGDPEVAEWGRVMFRDRSKQEVSLDAIRFTAVWPSVIENWDKPEERARIMHQIERGRHGAFARLWLETVERSLAAEDRLKALIERWRSTILSDQVPGGDQPPEP